MSELKLPWDRNTTGVLCPPLDLLLPTVQKLCHLQGPRGAPHAGPARPRMAPRRHPAHHTRLPPAPLTIYRVGQRTDAKQGLERSSAGGQSTTQSGPQALPRPAGAPVTAADYDALLVGAPTRRYVDGPLGVQRVTRLPGEFG